MWTLGSIPEPKFLVVGIGTSYFNIVKILPLFYSGAQSYCHLWIRTIYQFAFQTYADLPRGPIKNNSMKKLCASTLSEILPPEVSEKINKKLEEDPGVSSHDFITLVGMLSYF